MELRIFNQILFGSLKPWNFKIQNQRDWAENFNKARQASENYSLSLKDAFDILLKEYPNVYSGIENEIPEHISLSPLFYSENLSPVSLEDQFYELLINLEVKRVLNTFNEFSEGFSIDIDGIFQVEKFLTNLKSCLVQTHENLSEVEDFDNKELSEKVLNFMFHRLLILFFDTQIRYHHYNRSPLSLQDFYIQELGTPAPETAVIHPTLEYFYNKIETALELKNQELLEKLILELNDYPEIESAIENAIFLIQEYVTVDECFNEEYTSAKFTEHKSILESDISQKTYGIERVSLIESYLETFKSFNSTSSIPGRLKHWLEQQKVIYSHNPANTFPVTTITEEVVTLQDKPMPVATKGINALKEIAYKHLAFFKGTNEYNSKIMKDSDHDTLMDWVYELIETEKVPFIAPPLKQINLTNNMIRYTFYLIHKELYGTQKIKIAWIDFIHKAFTQFQGTETSTTKTKFSTKPAKYEAIRKAMIG
ncbi:MAG: hypothetical protein NXI00_14505 [Cytophagales bacterium]|nr:hypothetical protein [Cytophagales bacterium]